MGIAIDQKHLEALDCEAGGKVDGCGGLANSALLVYNAENLTHGSQGYREAPVPSSDSRCGEKDNPVETGRMSLGDAAWKQLMVKTLRHQAGGGSNREWNGAGGGKPQVFWVRVSLVSSRSPEMKRSLIWEGARLVPRGTLPYLV